MQRRHRILLFTGALLFAVALCLPWKYFFSPRVTPAVALPAPEPIAKTTVEPSSSAPAMPAPVARSAAAPSLSQRLSAQDRRKLETLHEILRAENDNDPRLDTELVGLGALKGVLREEYAKLAPEKRNARGTIVFLIGRELETQDDMMFMASVLSETPCLSLQDCRLAPPASSDPDATTGTDVALAYPQIVAIKSLEAYLEKSAAVSRKSVQPELASTALDALARGRISANPRVANWSARTLERYSH